MFDNNMLCWITRSIHGATKLLLIMAKYLVIFNRIKSILSHAYMNVWWSHDELIVYMVIHSTRAFKLIIWSLYAYKKSETYNRLNFYVRDWVCVLCTHQSFNLLNRKRACLKLLLIYIFRAYLVRAYGRLWRYTI